MQITKVNPSFGTKNNNKKINYAKVSGYAGAASLAACAVAAKLKKPHTIWAALSLLFTAAHIGILESYKFKNTGKKA